MSAPGQDYSDALKTAGVSDLGVAQWQANYRDALKTGGMSDDGIKQYFGDGPAFNPKPVQDMVAGNIAQKQPAAPGETPKQLPTEAPGSPAEQGLRNVTDAFQNGWQMSVAGLQARHAMPERMPQDHLPFAYRMAQFAGQAMGDLPANISGFMAGAESGGALAAPAAVVPGIGEAVIGTGAAIGGMAGAFALPAAARQAMIESYTKGEVKSFRDWFSRAANVTLAASKGAALGAVTGGAGLAAGEVLGAVAPGLSPFAQRSAVLASEVTAMTTVGKAMEGQVPEPKDFLENALIIGTMHGLSWARTKGIEDILKQNYIDTNTKPGDIVKEAVENPRVMNDLISSNISTPGDLRPAIDPKAVPEGTERIPGKPDPVPMQSVPAPTNFSEENGGIPTPDLKMEKTEEPAQAEPVSPGGGPPSESNEPPGETPPKTNADRIVYETKQGLLPQAWDAAKDFWANRVARIFDRADPIKQASDLLHTTAPEGSDRIYTLSRNERNKAAGMIRSAFEVGVPDFKTGQLRPDILPLRDISEMVDGNLKELDLYMADQQALELEAQGKQHGFDIEASQANVDSKAGSDYEKAAIEMRKFRDGIVDYLRDSGRINSKTVELMRDVNKFHVPFYRYIPESDGGAIETGPGGQPLKRREGSELQILSPINSIINDTMRFMQMAEKNRTRLETVTQQEAALRNNPEGEAIFTKVRGGVPEDAASSPISKDLATRTDMDQIDAKYLASQIATPTLADNEFVVYRDGVPEVWSGDKDIVGVLKEQDKNTRGLAIQLATNVANFKRTGVTGVLEFGLRHPFGDQIRAYINSGGEYSPFVDWAKGLMHIITGSDLAEEWKRNGGAFSAVMDSEKVMSDNFQDYAVKTGYLATIKNMAMTPIHIMEAINRASIDATKVGYYAKLSEKYPDMPLSERILKSREVSTDFSSKGNSQNYQNMSAMKAFMNAELQGTYQSYKAFRDFPVKATQLALISITAPTILNWLVNRNDERYQDENAAIKALAWTIPLGNPKTGFTLRIPKPPGIGQVFGSFPEMILNALVQGDRGARQHPFISSLPNYLQEPPVPDVIAPPMEHFFNHSFFTGNQIVSSSVEAKNPIPEYQYQPYTSETGKAISKLISDHLPWMYEHGPAPLYIDNYIQGWAGNAGKYATQLTDQLLIKTGMVKDPIKPEMPLADIPMVRAFIARWPTMGTQPIQDFYNRVHGYQQITTQVAALEKQGKYEEARKVMSRGIDQGTFLKMGTAVTAFGAMQSEITKITNLADMKPYAKRQKIDAIYIQMNTAAKQYNKELDQLEDLQRSKLR